nr:hypothetical protein CFP56_44774 [Quercus suber]
MEWVCRSGGFDEWVWGMGFLGFRDRFLGLRNGFSGGDDALWFGHCSTNELGLGWVEDEISFEWIGLGW